jgi:hypothetical protein
LLGGCGQHQPQHDDREQTELEHQQRDGHRGLLAFGTHGVGELWQPRVHRRVLPLGGDLLRGQVEVRDPGPELEQLVDPGDGHVEGVVDPGAW